MVFHLGAPGGVPASSGYSIARSLRFNDDDTAYLSRTPGGAGNRRLWTYSGWLKRANLGTNQVFLAAAISAGVSEEQLQFTTGNTIEHRDGSGVGTLTITTVVYRDPSAWYHIVYAYDSAQATQADRGKLYVNGVQQTLTTTAISLNRDSAINNNVAHGIGRLSAVASNYFDGYMADVNLVDGQALDPSYFGETDAASGAWKPKRYTGSYGTNGFFLSFANNASTTTLGYDDGTGAVGAGAGSNDWTLNNFSVTAGVGNDSLTDTPTNNYCVVSPIDKSANVTLANGSLDATTATAAWRGANATVGMSSGKWFWEVVCNDITAGATTRRLECGIAKSGWDQAGALPSSANGWSYSSVTGNKSNNSSAVAYGSTFGTSDVVGVAFDADAGSLIFYKNGVSQGTAYTGLTSGPYFPAFTLLADSGTASISLNFGQRAFAYSAPSGHSALCTANLPTPAIRKPSQQFNAVTYTGTGSSLGVTGVGHQPDLVWIKGRSGATDHALYDAVRGVQKQIESNTTTDETTETTGLTAFGADGFTVGALAQVNTNAATYVAWCWNEGSTPGFDIVTYTGNGANRTIAHNLGAAPNFMIVKARTTAGTDQGWAVYHSANTSAPATDYLLLNSTAATADLDTLWNDTAPTSSVFSVGTNALVNTNSDTYVAYLWSEVSGFSKFGSYTGNGSADGPFVWCGFRPRWVMIKRTDVSVGWIIRDAARNSANLTNSSVLADSSGVEASGYDIDILSNGFKVRNASDTGSNASGGTYIIAAFAEMPFKTANAR